MSMLLQVEGLTKHFPVQSGMFSRERKVVHAVDEVSFNIKNKENFGLVGESGSGKTTVARLVLRLIEPTAGSIHFMGNDTSKLSKKELRKLRRDMQIIFQNPSASLNSRKKVRHILSLPYIIHENLGKEEIQNKVFELLEAVGLNPPEECIERYPHEFSGGQKQRLGIARSMALHPKFIVADEPVASLDMSVRGQILNLMKELQNNFDVTYMYISHDLSVIRSMVDNVATMYLGKLVELAPVEEFFSESLSPYTRALISATPIADPHASRNKKRIILKGEIPSPINPPSGCRFRTRCPSVIKKCAKEEPKFLEVTKDHFVACHLYSN